jgi:hypothetical protein
VNISWIIFSHGKTSSRTVTDIGTELIYQVGENDVQYDPAAAYACAHLVFCPFNVSGIAELEQGLRRPPRTAASSEYSLEVALEGFGQYNPGARCYSRFAGVSTG